MILHNIRKTKTGYTTFGCMWKKGEIMPADGLDLSDLFVCNSDRATDITMQSRITAFWPDHSIKWTAHTADAALLGDKCEVLLRDNFSKTEADGIKLEKKENGCIFHTKDLIISIPLPANGQRTSVLFDSVEYKGRIIWQKASPILDIIEPVDFAGDKAEVTRHYFGKIDKVTLESEGPVEACIKFEGTHVDKNNRGLIPFIIRLHIGLDLTDLRFEHTFMYDGDEDRDFLKGIGIRFETPLQGEIYNRHIKFMNEHGMFHEAMVHLQSWRPRVPVEYFKAQLNGEPVEMDAAHTDIFEKVINNTPFWDTYTLCQDSDRHFSIKKKLTGDHLCYIPAISGGRTRGGAAFGSRNGSTIVASRDFWEKYPSGVTVKGMSSDTAECTIWFWSPDAAPMDFRHYADRGYNQVCYEGYDYKGASPDGIACTSECMISYREAIIPTDEEICDLVDALNAPALFVADPEFYHEMKAFGYWSLPSFESETEQWIERELSNAFAFYKQEVEQRSWYGMFDYGDVMHTYDSLRHTWKYDMGGYAWDNTELVPTLWLWLYFMRTGREDVFTFAEKMSRHASEVDVYHFGKYKGLGSRHNVRHWGCPCKEARIAMAHHHRYLYYLTGDRRLEDIFDELKDNELSFLNKDPLGDFFDKKDMVYPSHARSGPDWSSLVSNWMTEWERHDDPKYMDKILVGIRDIYDTPLKLSSGPDFEFDPATVHLRYIGERTTGGCHLQVCMGAPSIWLETADLLEDDYKAMFLKMIADHGRFYFLPHEQQLAETNGLVGDRQSSLPMLATSMGAFGAAYLEDEWLAKRTWHILLETMITGREATGFIPDIIENQGNQAELKEIKWISTNFTAQWCLNAIMVKEFIGDSLPKTLDEVKALVADANISTLHTS